MNEYLRFQPVFEKIKARYDQNPAAGLACKQGVYTNCTVLKLQRPEWTNDPMDQVQNKSGIFFSIWIDDEAARLSRVKYNIHALKLRELKGYHITSRDFAAAFREGFSRLRDSWPNVTIDHGPLTLMEGWVEIEPAHCEDQIFALLQRFEVIATLIDSLLESRRK